MPSPRIKDKILTRRQQSERCRIDFALGKRTYVYGVSEVELWINVTNEG